MAAGSSVVDLPSATPVSGRRPASAGDVSVAIPDPSVAEPITAAALVATEVCCVIPPQAQAFVLGVELAVPLETVFPWRRSVVFAVADARPISPVGEVILGDTVRDELIIRLVRDTSIVLQARYDAMWSSSTFYVQHPWRLELSHREVALLRHVAQECRWNQVGVPTLVPELVR